MPTPPTRSGDHAISAPGARAFNAESQIPGVAGLFAQGCAGEIQRFYGNDVESVEMQGSVRVTQRCVHERKRRVRRDRNVAAEHVEVDRSDSDLQTGLPRPGDRTYSQRPGKGALVWGRRGRQFFGLGHG